MRRSLILSALVLALPACNRPTPASRAGRQLSFDKAREIVNTVRAGCSLKPASWPGGARVAVLLSFDVDNETLQLAAGRPTIGGLSQGQYGARVGLRRVVELLDRHDIPTTFFVPAVSLMLAPEMADLIKHSGRHEFGVHGWMHEASSALGAEAERELVQRAVDTLTRLTGVRPVGYRAPS